LSVDSLKALLENLRATVSGLAEFDTVDARIIFIGFPGGADTLTLPVWADSMASTLHNFIGAMSRGAQVLNVSVLRRTDAPESAWVAPYTAHDYVITHGGRAYQYCNRDVVRHISEIDSTVWVGVDALFMVQYQCLFPCSTTTNDWTCEASCPWGGVNVVMTDLPQEERSGIPGFGLGNMPGSTQRVFFWPYLNTLLAAAAAPWVAGHEYGHVLGLAQHTPGSSPPDTSQRYYNNPGRYDLMRAIGCSGCVQEGIIPYGPYSLNAFGWLPRVRVQTDTLGVRIPDIRSEDGFVIEIMLVNQQPGYLTRGRAAQWLWVLNDQGATVFDQKYGGTGLLVWHGTATYWGSESWLPKVWDLESAAGKFTGGVANPDSGRDALEANKNFLGSSDDFWGREGKEFFSISSNPNTNVYAYGQWSFPHAPQDSATSVSIENIHRDEQTGDMIVDIFLDPKQFVARPNGGEELSEGFPDTIRWTVRPHADITNVDLYVSVNSGETYSALATGVSNTGGYVWTPNGTGDSFRVKVVSHDSTGGTGADESDGDFTVRDVRRPAAIGDLSVEALGRHTVTLMWTAPGDDSLSGTANEYDLRYSTTTITDANFGSATQVTIGAPDTSGTAECAGVSDLNVCTTYYFAIKTADEVGNWSAISNVPSGKTRCSGTTEVFCEEGLMAQGGGAGGRWVLEDPVLEESAGAGAEPNMARREAALASVSPAGHSDRTSAWALGGAIASDTTQLAVPLEAIDGRVSIRLSPRGSATWGVDGARVAVVDHVAGETALLGAGGVLVGTLSAPQAVSSGGTDLTPTVASGEDVVTGAAGSTWDVTLGGPAALLLEVTGGARAAAEPDSGISVLVPDGANGWQPWASLMPGPGHSQLVVDSIPAGRARLVFGVEQAVARLARFDVHATATLNNLALVSAVHSQAGSVLSALNADSEVVVHAGESLVLSYQAAAIDSGQARDYFLIARGRRLSATSPTGSRRTVSPPTTVQVPTSFALHQNQPNPFRGTTAIRFDVPVPCNGRLEVFDMQGRRVRTLADGPFSAGFQSVPWDQRDASGSLMKPGVYLYRLQAGTFRAQRKLVLLP
jgi:hypothetical protein